MHFLFLKLINLFILLYNIVLVLPYLDLSKLTVKWPSLPSRDDTARICCTLPTLPRFPLPFEVSRSQGTGFCRVSLPTETVERWAISSEEGDLSKTGDWQSANIWLSATLWSVAHQAPMFMGFSRQEYWSGLPFPPPEDLLEPGIEPESPAWAGGFFTTEPPEKPQCH